MTAFDNWFKMLSGGDGPHPWQRELAERDDPQSRFIRVPTGLGKTLGVFAAWSWHRLSRHDESWPRRLVWCLPMRVLVEQTEAVVKDALDGLALRWDGAGDHSGKVGVHLLMGGADPGADWNLFPEEAAVLIGTQDMLLSRALNRGYASPRARWPLDFGLVSHDALWVMDEVQLMDVGLATSAQVQAFCDDDRKKGWRPRTTWWMSATLQHSWLESVDTRVAFESWRRNPCVIAPEHLKGGPVEAAKALEVNQLDAADATGMAELVLEKHAALADGEHGRVTLVVCNTVARACATFEALRECGRKTNLELVHSRFRPAERKLWREGFLNRRACKRGIDRIIVATQVVEAGVDISASCLITELAPWPNLVQRFGRCARYGGSGKVVVLDLGTEEKSARPYEAPAVEAARRALQALQEVGIRQLEAYEARLSEEERIALYPYAPKHLLLRREYDELFDTTPDLTGADLDISRFIRTGEERDLQVFWLTLPPTKKALASKQAPREDRRPRREELCAVPFLAARDWLCGEETKSDRKPRLLVNKRAWVWDWLDGEWQRAERASLVPGRIICVDAACGGYCLDAGFDADATDAVPEVETIPLPRGAEQQEQADDEDEKEALSASAWKTIGAHVGEVADLAGQLAQKVGLPSELARIASLAGRWHDIGKSHPAFQRSIQHPERPQGENLAKAPELAWTKPMYSISASDKRPGFRHELASALALFAVLARHQPLHPALLGPWIEVLGQMGHSVPSATADGPPTAAECDVLACGDKEFDLLAYLVASHHGKVRIALHASPKDQEYLDSDGHGLPIRGVREGDQLPSLVVEAGGPAVAAIKLSLSPASLGLSARTGRSWRERTLGLLATYGPSALAWMEALLMAADRRASRLTTIDPDLHPQGTP